jgi:hypothetical protein
MNEELYYCKVNNKTEFDLVNNRGLFRFLEGERCPFYVFSIRKWLSSSAYDEQWLDDYYEKTLDEICELLNELDISNYHI